MNALITGIRSGIGKYLYECFGGYGLERSNCDQLLNELSTKGVEVIIHCAYNPSRDICSDVLYDYLSDTVLLASRLISIPHNKFILFSTIDIYPNSEKKHFENEKIAVSSLDNIYSITKLMVEAIVLNSCCGPLILRPSAMLGKYSRENSLLKILYRKKCQLTLSSDSCFNYILYSDVRRFIVEAIEKGNSGIYNLASSENIMLSEIASMTQNQISFGDYSYNCGIIDNTQAIRIMPDFSKTSKEAIDMFKEEGIWQKY